MSRGLQASCWADTTCTRDDIRLQHALHGLHLSNQARLHRAWPGQGNSQSRLKHCRGIRRLHRSSHSQHEVVRAAMKVQACRRAVYQLMGPHKH